MEHGWDFLMLNIFYFTASLLLISFSFIDVMIDIFLILLFSPDIILIIDFGIFKNSDKNKMSASLALPSTGGELTLIFI